MSFQQSTYDAYKIATSKFIDWILVASSHIKLTENDKADKRQSSRVAKTATASKKNEEIPVSQIKDLVRVISSAYQEKGDSLLPLELWMRLSKALRACAKAVKLRGEQTSRFQNLFGADSLAVGDQQSVEETNRKHEFFRSSLQSWYDELRSILQRVSVNAQAAAAATESAVADDSEEAAVQRSAALFNLLTIEDTEEDDNDVDGAGSASIPTSTVSAAAVVIDHQFEDDLYFQLLCMVNDVDELLNGLSEAFIAVKQEKQSLLTVAAMADAATKYVERLDATIQLKYPSLDTFMAIDHAGIKPLFPQKFYATMEKKVIRNIEAYRRSVPIRGLALLDMRNVVLELVAFCSAIPAKPSVLHLRPGMFGPDFNEVTAPLSHVTTDSRRVLMKELANLYSAVMGMDGMHIGDRQTEHHDPCETFLGVFKRYFRSKKVTLTLVFLTTVWLRSIVHLQGGGFLGRTVYLAKKMNTSIERSLRTSIVKRRLEAADPKFHAHALKIAAAMSEHNNEFMTVCRVNPLLAGATVLSNTVLHMKAGADALSITSRFRGFGHLYSALLDRGFIAPIELIDQLLRVFHNVIFYPSRPSNGSFADCYLLSSHITAAALAAFKRKQPALQRGDTKVREKADPEKLSALCKLLRSTSHDLSKVIEPPIFDPKNPSNSSSSKSSNSGSRSGAKKTDSFLEASALLSSVQRLCDSDLHSLNSPLRVFGLDLLALNDAIGELYERIVKELNLSQRMQRFLSGPQLGDAQWMRNYAMEAAVLNPLLLQLDHLHFVDPSQEPRAAAAGNTTASAADDEVKFRFDLKAYAAVTGEEADVPAVADSIELFERGIVHSARQIGAIITDCFTNSNSSGSSSSSGNSSDVLSRFQVLPMDTTQLFTAEFGSREFKVNTQFPDVHQTFSDVMDVLESAQRKLSPAQLQQVKATIKRCPGILGIASFADSLPTILHQASAGAAADEDFAEWLVHMGALLHTEQHVFTALHSAIGKKNYKMVRMLVEVDHLRSINTPTLSDGDTPLHIAARMNSHEIVLYLHMRGAQFTKHNKAGLLPHQQPTIEKSLRLVCESFYEQQVGLDIRSMNHKSRDVEMNMALRSTLDQSRQQLEQQKKAESTRKKSGK